MSALPPKANIKTWRPVLSLSLSVNLTAASNERLRLSDQVIVIVQPEIDLLRCHRLGGGAVWHQPRGVTTITISSIRPTQLILLE